RRARSGRRHQPPRPLRQLRRTGAAAAERARAPPARPARAPVGAVRTCRCEASVRRAWILPATRAVLIAGVAVLIGFLPRLVSEFRVSQFTYVGIYFIALLGLNILTGYNGQISLGHAAFMAIGGYTAAALILGRPGFE